MKDPLDFSFKISFFKERSVLELIRNSFLVFTFSLPVLMFFFLRRFTRRGVDPAPLAQHGLVTELLHRLSNAAGPTTATLSTPGKYS